MQFLAHRSIATLLIAAGTIVAACSEVTPPSRTMRVAAPTGAAPAMFTRIKASDSTLALTNTTYLDTSLVLKRLVPLTADSSASMVIGPDGGVIKIGVAGVEIDFPKGALATPTLITMTAFAGPNVAYDFQPHGITFAQPVVIHQTLHGTTAEHDPALSKGIHGSYYGVSLDSAWIDPAHNYARASENELGYAEVRGSKIKFFIGHFSGYMVSCGEE